MKKILILFTAITFSVFGAKIGDREFIPPVNLENWEQGDDKEKNIKTYILEEENEMQSFLLGIEFEKEDLAPYQLGNMIKEFLNPLEFNTKTTIVQDTETFRLIKVEMVNDQGQGLIFWLKTILSDEGVILLSYCHIAKSMNDDFEEKNAVWEEFFLSAS